jgi:DNA (cytosine-5)-methyltransferase 1
MLDEILSDLENINYSCQTFIIPACALDAPHRRDRIFILANANRARMEGSEIARGPKKSRQITYEYTGRRSEGDQWKWEAEPAVDRVADGVSRRMDRIKSLVHICVNIG